MNASARTLSAVAIAFVAGIAATVSLMPSKAPTASATAPRSQAAVAASAAKVAEAAKPVEAPSRQWVDPVRPQVAVNGSSEPAAGSGPVDARKLAFGKDADIPEEGSAVADGREIAEVPAPPPRPASLSQAEVHDAPVKAAVPRTARQPAPVARVAHGPATFDEVRRSDARPPAARIPDRRTVRSLNGPEPREARLPRRDYAYAYGEPDPYVEERGPPMRTWRPEYEPRATVRRGGGSDGLLRWLSEPGQRY
jgi:hypothetical protein